MKLEEDLYKLIREILPDPFVISFNEHEGSEYPSVEEYLNDYSHWKLFNITAEERNKCIENNSLWILNINSRSANAVLLAAPSLLALWIKAEKYLEEHACQQTIEKY